MEGEKKVEDISKRLEDILKRVDVEKDKVNMGSGEKKANKLLTLANNSAKMMELGIELMNVSLEIKKGRKNTEGGIEELKSKLEHLTEIGLKCSTEGKSKLFNHLVTVKTPKSCYLAHGDPIKETNVLLNS